MKCGNYELVKAPLDYPGKKYRDKYCYEHHLVWWQITGNIISEKEVIHHINENKRDNRFENLELLNKKVHTSNHSKNMSKETKLRISKSVRGNNNGQSKLSLEKVKEIHKYIEMGYSQRQISKIFNVSHTTIGNIHRGECWSNI